MTSNPIRIWEGVSASKSKKLWGSQSISNINTIIKNNISGDYRITSATLNVYANFDGAFGLANVYMKYGFGSTNSISTQLGGERKLTKNDANYPNSITSYISSDKKGISTSYGSHFVANIYTTNAAVGSSGALHLSYVDLVVDYVIPYTITLNANGGTCPVSSITRYSGETYGTVTSGANNPTKAGHTFSYWSTNADGTGRIYGSTVVTGNTTLYAQYTVNSYTISKEVSPSGSGDVTGAGTYEYGKSATLEAVPNAGYRFIKWNDDVTTNPRTVTVTGNVIYTAYFEQIPPPKFTSVEIKYLDKQVSPSNKVIVNESFIISVSVT